MMIVIFRAILTLLRLGLLILPIYCCLDHDHLVLGTVVLIVGYPIWEALIYELRLLRPDYLLRPNWRKAKRGKYNHLCHQFTLTFPGGSAAAHLADVYTRLKDFEDFDGYNNEIARKRIEIIGDKKYVYFESLRFFGLMSLLCNPRECPVRVWSRRQDHLVIADTVFGHMLKGQRRWQVKEDGHSGIEVSTYAYDRPRNLANRIGMMGMRLMGADLQVTIWTAYLENIAQHYEEHCKASSTPVIPSVVRQVLPAPPQDPDWVPLAVYPGREV